MGSFFQSRRKIYIKSICFFLILTGFSCTKEKEEDKAATVFYKKQRSVLLHEDFELGMSSKTLDSLSYHVVSGFAYIQSGQFADKQIGFFNIGSPPPLNISDTVDSLKTYSVGFLDTLYDFRTVFPFQAMNEKIGIEITYRLKGKTEFYFNDRFVVIDKYQIPTNETIMNISLGNDFAVYMDDNNVTSIITSTSRQISNSRIEFFVRNEVVKKDGLQIVNYYGMRIKEIEIYTF